MAYATGITRYQKKKWLDQLKAAITAGTMRLAIFVGNSHAVLDANTDAQGSTFVYDALVAAGVAELSASGTGYTTGGFVLDEPVVVASGNTYRLQFSGAGAAAGQIVTEAGTIATGNYTGVMYETVSGNCIEAIFPVAVSVASSNGVMTFTVPADAVSIS